MLPWTSARVSYRRLSRDKGFFRTELIPWHFLTILYERYRFSAEGIRYLIDLVGPYVGNATQRSRALTVAQCVCVSLRFFATGTYLHAVGDAERIGKNTVCRAIHKVVAALNILLHRFVAFPSFLPSQIVKEGFYTLSGKIKAPEWR